MPRRKTSLPPWHPKILIPSVLFGLPAAYFIKWAAVSSPKKWREFPQKLPHLVILWIQNIIEWTQETFTIEQLLAIWLALLAIIYFLPSSTGKDWEQRRLEREIEELEQEVQELAEEFQELNPEFKLKNTDKEIDAERQRMESGRRRYESKKKK
mmetsp:Transcript_44822/g.101183  ORF Transcript_44822/g.101183 Transcript_44822/m.101183 type:complete len:154 (+) Transcript_44822:157-618(+)|eukprot:CAMPEP_0172597104 /NCGR_PEP_ID=MMETSP1068-20121228/17049_1 /TAXON_ID=35684 /ORGANISM="Pseudopedinella elastica, Strain CCMP716" /LENGTH=153 /DNA_ID=CAMNT_0013396471 /DNA_START=134 /DNA_END=595 /DNA_ORIENTATION=+